MQVKLCGTNVLSVSAYELLIRRGTKIIIHAWIGQNMSQVEYGKNGLPPASHRATP